MVMTLAQGPKCLGLSDQSGKAVMETADGGASTAVRSWCWFRDKGDLTLRTGATIGERHEFDLTPFNFNQLFHELLTCVLSMYNRAPFPRGHSALCDHMLVSLVDLSIHGFGPTSAF